MSEITTDYFLLRFSVQPKRYALIKNSEMAFIFGTRALRMFFPNILPAMFDTEKGKVVYLSASKLQELQQEEDKFLLEDMLGYLAQNEKSPLDLKNWLAKRGLKKQAITNYLQLAKKQRFLDPLRFAAYFVQKKMYSPWPWWVVRNNLLHHGVPAEEVDSFFYEDGQALKNKYQQYKFNNVQKQKTQLRTKLIGRGFSVALVKDLLVQLTKELNNDENETKKPDKKLGSMENFIENDIESEGSWL